MSKFPVTVCIIAKNEENFIEECLKRLMPYGMEIIVADTGSTDRTREIAEKYADKVVDFEWINDFSAARNYCASFASNNWILALDCDEHTNSIDLRILRVLMQKFPRKTGVLRLKNLVHSENGDMGYRISDLTRFYNKNYYTFDYAIHEQICTKDLSKRDEPMDAFLLPMEVIHHGYALDDEKMKEKQIRNLELLYKDLEEGEASSKPDKAYTYFQIGQSEVTLEHMDKALYAYESGEKLITDEDFGKNYIPELIMALSEMYVKLERTADAVAMMEKYMQKMETAIYMYTYANTLLEDNQIIKALGTYIKVTMMKDASEMGDGLRNCYGRIISIYEALGEKDMAKLFHDKFLACEAEKERVINS